MARPQSPSDRDQRLEAALGRLGAYGADEARWPAEAHSLFAEFAGEAAFETARAEAAALDAALAADVAPEPGPGLAARILEDHQSAPRRAPAFDFAALFDFSAAGRRWAPAGVLAGLTALGFALGVASTSLSAAGEDEALVFVQAAFASLEEEEPYWAAE
jgi:hypothetical protein